MTLSLLCSCIKVIRKCMFLYLWWWMIIKCCSIILTNVKIASRSSAGTSRKTRIGCCQLGRPSRRWRIWGELKKNGTTADKITIPKMYRSWWETKPTDYFVSTYWRWKVLSDTINNMYCISFVLMETVYSSVINLFFARTTAFSK